MLVETYPSSNPHFVKFGRVAEELAARRSPVEQPLTSILQVGALYNSQEGLSPRDGDWLANSLLVCARLGVPVPRNFQYTPLNYINGDDFLDPCLKVSADIVIASLIPTFNRLPTKARSLIREAFSGNPLISTSPLDTQKAWYEACIRVNARLAIAVVPDDDCYKKSGAFSSGTYDIPYIGSREFTGAGFTMGPTFPAIQMNDSVGSETYVPCVIETVMRNDLKVVIRQDMPGIK